MKRTAIQKELVSIASKNRGVLRPEDVVEVAEDENSVLHSCFEWDDKAASHQYRIWQARKLITSYRIRIVGIKQEKPSRMYVSLKQDRYQERGGYRSLKVVLSQPNLREQLLSEAFEELKYFREKYRHLEELKGVFEAMDKAKRKKKKALVV